MPVARVLTARVTIGRRKTPASKVQDVRPQPPAQVAPVRVRARRGAVAVAVGLLGFVAVQLLTDQAIRREWVPLRDPLYFDRLALLRSHPAFFEPPGSDRPTTVLFVGSSRTLNAVDAGALGPTLATKLGRPVAAFNFAQAGAGPVTNAVYVRRLIAAGAKPDFVVIEVHPVFLAGQRPDPPETRWLLPIRLRPDEFPVVRAMGFPAEVPPAHGPRGRLAPWYEYRFLITDRYAPFLVLGPKLNAGHEPDEYGFARTGTVTPEEGRLLARLTHAQYADYFPGFRPTGPGLAAVRDTLARCRAAGWTPALALLPESAEFRGWYPADGLREFEAVLAELACEFQAPLIDARTWVPDELIADGHHLTGPGADVLTEKLALDALAPWLAEHPGRTP